MIYLAMLVLLNALFGFFLVFFLFYLIIKRMRGKQTDIKSLILLEIDKSLGNDNIIAQKLEQLDLKAELGPFLVARLEQVFQQLASQIPMGEFLLAGALGKKIKQTAQNEVLNVLPELKEHFIQRVNQNFDLKKQLKEKIQDYDFSHLIDQIEKHAKKEKIKLAIWSALLGGLLGLFEGCLSLISF